MSRTVPTDEGREQWAAWLATYGAENFYDAFMATAQDAKSVCAQCGENIYLDIAEGGGVADWRTDDGDYGCPYSPDTGPDGTGDHDPERG